MLLPVDAKNLYVDYMFLLNVTNVASITKNTEDSY